MNETLEQDRKVQVRAVLSFVIILAIIGITILGIVILVVNKRVAKEEDKERIVPAVVTVEVVKSDYAVKISTQGVVESMRRTMLAAEVGGRVMEISQNLKRGGVVKEGERLVQIDPADYRSALANSEVGLAEAELALEQERAQVEQAKLDWEKIGRGEPTNPLVLRGPQLAAAEARAGSSREEAARARRDVERTEIFAPFEAGVRSANVEVGAVVAPGTMVAELYAIGELEVRLPLSLEDFGFLSRDENGEVIGEVTLTGKIGTKEYSWAAIPVRLDPEIERKTLSASVVVKVEVADRAEFSLPPVGLFLDATLGGEILPDVAEIPRRGLLEGNRVITVNGEGKIDFREVEVVRLTAKTAVVHQGLEAGDRVVLTRLTAPVVGMEVEVETAEEPEEDE
ncbi:MAG: efflux RND transporter periplasmic adaptor subunit [Verrucomicrobia bacterium]|nr:efflux RND transporter periplasmic adaptor subunit [Verrucomicrobiota bacterium]|tara:strand:+ start:64798 stop:65991 length:1194 start_codon:yes stop_codon:yes gene_type:complete